MRTAWAWGLANSVADVVKLVRSLFLPWLLSLRDPYAQLRRHGCLVDLGVPSTRKSPRRTRNMRKRLTRKCEFVRNEFTRNCIQA